MTSLKDPGKVGVPTERPQQRELLAALKSLTADELDPDTLAAALAARLARSRRQVELDLLTLDWMYTMGPDGLAEAQGNAREEAIVRQFAKDASTSAADAFALVARG